jgi:ABC-type phosphate transport system substrate-binding protein
VAPDYPAALNNTTTASTASGAAPSGGPGTLTGVGSTYVALFFATCHQQHSAVTVTYSSLGSKEGIAGSTGF